MKCKRCGSVDHYKWGTRFGKQRYKCKQCNLEFLLPKQQNAIIIGDSHIPYEHEGYLEFCYNTAKKYDVTDFYHVGDIVDNHAISYHEVDPRSKGASGELEEAIEHLQDWYEAFPILNVCYGNHDSLFSRKAKTIGLPSQAVRSLPEILGAPEGWTFDYEFEFGDVLITHGTGFSGMYAFTNASRYMMRSVVIGHCHSVCGIQYTASADKLIYGMSVGCGIDRHEFAFDYGKNLARKPILSCGLIIDGTPIIEVMKL